MWRHINCARKKRTGQSITSVTVLQDNKWEEKAEQEDIEDTIMENIIEKFKLTTDTFLMKNDKLNQDIDFLGDTPASKDILDQVYDFVEDIDGYTLAILKSWGHSPESYEISHLQCEIHS